MMGVSSIDRIHYSRAYLLGYCLYLYIFYPFCIHHIYYHNLSHIHYLLSYYFVYYSQIITLNLHPPDYSNYRNCYYYLCLYSLYYCVFYYLLLAHTSVYFVHLAPPRYNSSGYLSHSHIVLTNYTAPMLTIYLGDQSRTVPQLLSLWLCCTH